MSSTIVRHALASDAASLQPLFEQLGYPTDSAEIHARLESRDATRDVLVACDGDTIAGFIGVSIEDDFVAGRYAAVHGLVVADGFRNRGIGATLLRAAERWAVAHGAALLKVRTNVIREDAHRFYEREGYTRHKSQHIFQKTLSFRA